MYTHAMIIIVGSLVSPMPLGRGGGELLGGGEDIGENTLCRVQNMCNRDYQSVKQHTRTRIIYYAFKTFVIQGLE